MRDKLAFIETVLLVSENIWKACVIMRQNDLLLIGKGNFGFAKICNLFSFWYNEDTKRAEWGLDSDVDRWKDGG